MKGSTDIVLELQAISPEVAGIPEHQVLTVPEGYFDRFPEMMLQKVKALERAGSGLNEAEEEIAALSPLLAGMSRNMPMKAPEGYFQAIPQPAREEKAPVVSMPRRNFRLYAVAASVVAILGFALLLFRMGETGRPSSQNNVSISAELPKLSEKELDEFLSAFPELGSTEPITVAAGSVEVEDMISDIEEEGLEAFLSEMPELRTEKLN